MSKYKIRYKEVGRDQVRETTYSGPLSETEVIAFFGLDGDDVEWYEVRRKVRLYNDSESRVFDCVADAIRFLGQKSSANIQKVLHNYPHYYTIKGYKAEYYEPVQ